MRHWWVNQNQTYKAEIEGGYVWSPKRNKNGARNQFYENMREIAPLPRNAIHGRSHPSISGERDFGLAR